MEAKDLDALTLKELVALAKERGIAGSSKLRKAELIVALRAAVKVPQRSGQFATIPREHRSNARSRRWWRRSERRAARRGGAA